jgi:hypothetical protein
MRLPGAALLIVIGLFLLWIATTGKLDKLATAYDYIRDKTPSPESGKTGLPTVKPASNVQALASVVDVPSYHMGNMVNSLAPGNFEPGGML